MGLRIMRIVVIGLGSMGKRRLRILCKMKPDFEFLGIDAREERRIEAKELAKELGCRFKTYMAISDLPDDIEVAAAIISASPLSHKAIIQECLTKGWNIFTELNLVSDGYDENMETAQKKKLLLYLSSTPMFRNEIKFITKRVKMTEGILNYVYHVGQYLPDWHPWESYKDFFIGTKRTNGCREILAVELPWIVRCFGEIDSVKAVSLRQTNLEIDFQDCYNILITHRNGHKGVIIADVVCRTAVRHFEVYGEQLYLSWNGSTDGLNEYDINTGKTQTIDLYSLVERQEGYNPLIIENAYEAELMDFFEALAGRKIPEYGFEKDKKILKWIDEVETCPN